MRGVTQGLCPAGLGGRSCGCDRRGLGCQGLGRGPWRSRFAPMHVFPSSCSSKPRGQVHRGPALLWLQPWEQPPLLASQLFTISISIPERDPPRVVGQGLSDPTRPGGPDPAAGQVPRSTPLGKRQQGALGKLVSGSAGLLVTPCPPPSPSPPRPPRATHTPHPTPYTLFPTPHPTPSTVLDRGAWPKQAAATPPTPGAHTPPSTHCSTVGRPPPARSPHGTRT